MNNVSLVGRISKMEPKTSNSGKHYVFFVLAVDNIRTDDTDWIPCTVWGKDAENMVKYVHKGYRVSVIGSLSSYKKQNGDQALKVNVNPGGIEFLTSKKEAEGMNRNNQAFNNQPNQPNQQNQSNSNQYGMNSQQRDPFNQAPQPDAGFADTDDIPY